MSAAALLDRLATAGVLVVADGDSLTVDAPAGSLSPALLAELRRHKPALIALLTGAPPACDLNTPRNIGANSNNQMTDGEESAVARRAAAMRERHPRPWRAVPTLTARAVPPGAGGCLSCGEVREPVVVGLSARCRACADAARLVLAGEG